MAVTIATIAAKILPDTSGSPEIQRIEAVIDAVREFSRRSDYFRSTEEKSFTSQESNEYGNDYLQFQFYYQSRGYHLWRMESLFVDGLQKNIAMKDDIRPSITDLSSIYGSETIFYKTESRYIKLFPFDPDTDFATSTGAINIVATAVFIPGDDITEIDDALYDRWGKAIESGAKAEMMMMVGKPWTNPQMAGVHAQIFNAAINSAVRKRNLEDAGGEMFVEKIPFI